MGRAILRRGTGAAITKSVSAFALAGVLVAVVVQPAEAAPTTLYVNASSGNDTGTCHSVAGACATISYALTQAGAGATINVAAGTYPQQLTITQSVTIIGTAPNVIIEPPIVSQNDIDADSTTPQFAIVDVHNAGHAITNVNLEDLTVNGAAAGTTPSFNCGTNFPGIYYHNASGELINDDVINVEMPPALFGCQTGAGMGVLVHSNTGDVSNVVMTKLTVTNYQKGGITCFDLGTTCVISESTITGLGPTALTSQNGVLTWGTSSFSFVGNHVSQNTFNGDQDAQAVGLYILNAGTVNVRKNIITANDVDVYAQENASYGLVAPAGQWSFVGNLLQNATDDAPAPWNVEGQGYGDGMDVDSTSNAVLIKRNRTISNFEYGIALFGTTGVTVKKNNLVLHAHGNYDGIYVGGPGSAVASSTRNTITGNKAFFERNAGIMADVTTTESQNTFSRNDLKDNPSAAQDLSAGSRTAGTANTWSGNHCGSGPVADPAGIC